MHAMSQSSMALSLIFWFLTLSYGQELLTPYRGTNSKLSAVEGLQTSDLTSSLPPASCVPASQRNSCEEQDFDYLNGIVRCVDGMISLTPCYCLSNDTQPLLGHCQFTCFRNSFLTATNISLLQENQCSHFNRTGLFCGNCTKGTAYPAYSFTLKCVPCEQNWRNIVKYVAVAYGPLTMFLLLLMVFRVSVNSGPLLGYIFVAQISSVSFQMRLGIGMIEGLNISEYQKIGFRVLGTAYGIWNLDFFRSVIPPFCLHPHWNTIQVMCLDYLISSYPFILIFVTYTIVEFYSRGYKICCMWRPFHCCFARLKNEMNIRTSLVDAFGTFFSLSYAKTLSTSVDILGITQTWNSNDTEMGYKLYYAATEPINPYYVILGLLLFLVFNVIPVIVLLFYSLKKPPQRDNSGDVQGFFQPFFETLLAPYRDGRDGGHNCRFFSIVYLTARIVMNVALFITGNIFFQLVAAVILLITGMLVAVIKPYKSNAYNTVDTVLMLSLALGYTGVASYYFTHFIAPLSSLLAQVTAAVVCCIPLLYFLALVLYYVVVVTKLPQRVTRKVLNLFSSLRILLRHLRAKRIPRRENPVNISSTGTMYVAIESDTVRVSNVDLCQ